MRGRALSSSGDFRVSPCAQGFWGVLSGILRVSWRTRGVSCFGHVFNRFEAPRALFRFVLPVLVSFLFFRGFLGFPGWLTEFARRFLGGPWVGARRFLGGSGVLGRSSEVPRRSSEVPRRSSEVPRRFLGGSCTELLGGSSEVGGGARRLLGGPTLPGRGFGGRGHKSEKKQQKDIHGPQNRHKSKNK